MDELSWRAKLAKSNINILDAHDDHIFVEFTYHPKPGVFKWCKTMFETPSKKVVPEKDPVLWYKVPMSKEEVAQEILDRVLELRKELEN